MSLTTSKTSSKNEYFLLCVSFFDFLSAIWHQISVSEIRQTKILAVFLSPFVMTRNLTLKLLIWIPMSFGTGTLYAQQLAFPDGDEWKTLWEGTALDFRVKADSAGAKF